MDAAAGGGGQRDVSLGPGLSLCLGSTPTPRTPQARQVPTGSAHFSTPQLLGLHLLVLPRLPAVADHQDDHAGDDGQRHHHDDGDEAGVRRFMENWGGCSSR